jgi:hypothetical protein
MKIKLFLILAFSLLLGSCKDNDNLEVVIVNKILKEFYAGGDMSEDFHVARWYEIGLSRNGKIPVEYIWRAGGEPWSYYIANSKIGDKGIIYLSERGKQQIKKLPRPNAKNPPIIGTLGDIYWKK